MFSFSNKPQSILHLLRDTVILFFQSYLKMLPLFVVYIVAIVLSDSATFSIDYKTQVFLSFLFSVMALIVHCYFAPVIFKKYDILGRHSTESLKTILLMGIHKLPVIILNVFIAGVFVVVPYVLIAFLGAFVSPHISVFFSSHFAQLGFVALGFLWLTIATVFAVFLIPVIVFDQNASLIYIRKLVRLIWGNWWRVFGFLVIVSIPVALLHYAFNSMYLRGILTGYWVIVLLVIMQLILMPWYMSAIIVVYNDLKLRNRNN